MRRTQFSCRARFPKTVDQLMKERNNSLQVDDIIQNARSEMKNSEDNNDAFCDFVGVVAGIKIDGKTGQEIFDDNNKDGDFVINKMYGPENVSRNVIEGNGNIRAFVDASVTIVRETETDNHNGLDDVSDNIENGRSGIGEIFGETAASNRGGNKVFWHKNHDGNDNASETEVDEFFGEKLGKELRMKLGICVVLLRLYHKDIVT